MKFYETKKGRAARVAWITESGETVEWGCAPEDNRTTWERLREQAGFRLDEEAEAALNALIERP